MYKKIEKQIIKTRYVHETLELYAKQNLIPLSKCDFTINKINTYIKCNATGSFELYNQKTKKKFLDRKKIINEHVEFRQMFIITVMQREEKNLITLKYTIDYSNFSTHPMLILSPESEIPYKAYKPLELLKILYNECNKIKAQHKILINIFDEDMKKYLKLFVKYIYAGKFVRNIKIPLFNGIKPIITRPSKLIFLFKKKKHKSEIIEVDKGDLLIEYQKPIYGQNGLNAFGEYLDSVFPYNIDDLQAKIDKKSIRIEKTSTYKRYISKIRGYVNYNKKELSVDNKIKINEISRNRELANKTEKNNIEVKVTQHDASRDTIKEGATLISERIHVNGFVGPNSRLESVMLDIEGATHHSSSQYAKYANINRHKGTLRCHEANISVLEGGKVYASKVNIENSICGSIYAQDVTIGHVRNNLKVYATNSITIQHVSGEDNLFKINYRDVSIAQSKITFIDLDIKELEYRLEEAQKHNFPNIYEIEQQIQKLKQEKISIENSYQNAKITIKEPFRGLNTISFAIDSSHEITYNTEDKAYSKFYLEIQDTLVTLQPVNQSIVLND